MRSGSGRWTTRPFSYVFLDATYVKVRATGRVVAKAVIIATGVTASGDREVLGTAVGDSEDEAFWTDFVRSLRRRGLTGVLLVVSDAHQGLRNASPRPWPERVGSDVECIS